MSVTTMDYGPSLITSTLACETMNRAEQPCRFDDSTSFMQNKCGNMTAFMLLLQTVMLNDCEIADPCRRPETNDINDDEQFDFIVVGAGLAGPVIVRRLVDHFPSSSILLVEAGPSEPTMNSFPGFAFNAINSDLDWNFKTEPTEGNPTACLETDGVCSWPRGKMISGTSGFYGMMYIRGHPDIYNSWADDGSTGWSYDEIEKYFDRAEDFQDYGMIPNDIDDDGGYYYDNDDEEDDDDDDDDNNDIDNNDIDNNDIDDNDNDNNSTEEDSNIALLKVEYFHHNPMFSDVILTAAQELGYTEPTWKGPNQTGFLHAPMITDNGQRGTTSRFYLRPIAHAENLKVLINAYVTRIIKNEQDNGVDGIELIDKKGNKKIIKANKEVIISAGAVGSPQILLSSGIGPKEDLENLNISVWQDLPVGKNLHNHVSVGISMSINDTYYQDITLESINEFIDNRSGPLSSTGITQITAFLESNYSIPGVPDIQIFFDGFSSVCPNYGLDRECHNGRSKSCPDRRSITARPTTVIPRTRGTLKLRSNNPEDPPLIYPDYFTDPVDLEILLDGIKKVTELPETDAMKAWDLRLEEEIIPECSSYEFASDFYWRCLSRVKTGPENHQAGTCKMGAADDPSSVVDPELRVIGISGLRVADASIFPTVPNGNPAAGIVMVAEKAADLIIQTWDKE
ncbi:glucose dehydrogenase [FAD, quinone]-like [Aphidius gifuensis]|nr:glucose dehydrogenase [FAD, quinone]-like [Aphidius gifuensis]